MDQTQKSLNSSNDHIKIDGSLYEGGGQIFRISLALSIILQKKVTVTNIRQSRPNPGINNQLSSVIQLIGSVVKSQTIGNKMGSQEITFEPFETPEGGNFECGGKSAQSVNLMLQCLLPIFCFAKKSTNLVIRGGTTVSKSPPSASIQNCFIPLIQRMGVNLEYQVIKEGFYPKGMGILKVKIDNCVSGINPISLLKKEQLRNGFVKFYLTKELPYKEYFKRIEKQIAQFNIQDQQQQNQEKDNSIQFKVEKQLVPCKKFKEVYGVVVNAISENNSFDFSLLAQEDKTVDELLDQIEERIHHELSQGGTLDEFHQDQFLIFMALANGMSQLRVNKPLTDHSKAAIYVIKEFLPDLDIKVTEEDESILVQIVGIGIKANQQ